MNQNIQHLYDIAQKREKRIIGLMSGTSLDGLDIALCNFKGDGADLQITLEKFETIPYNIEFKNNITTVFSKTKVDLEKICLLNAWIGRQHGLMVQQTLKKWNISPTAIDLIASHGQTIFHAPQSLHGDPDFPNATLQIGDGDHIAVTTGIITLSDFRQKHVAAGGEGAPLAAYGDYLIFSKRAENRIMLNIGGIANFTYLPGDLNPDKVFCSDTGPGNTLMDAFVREHFAGIFFDKDAGIAKAGTISHELLQALNDHPFFLRPFPKTTGPELFNLQYLYEAQSRSGTLALAHKDIMATLNAFSAHSICKAIQQLTLNFADFRFFVSGGGMHNPLLMQHIESRLHGARFESKDTLEINPDAKEAVLFAVLANETVGGGHTYFGSGRNGIPNISMGKISFPT